MVDAPPKSVPTSDSYALAPLRDPVFRAVWLSNMVSNFGGLIQSVGAAWMMLTLGASPQMVALVSASTTLPIMLLSLAAGAIADNHDRRRVMLAAQSFMLIISATLALCAWAGILSPWLLLTFTFLIGCGLAFNGPAWQSSVSDMVSRQHIPAAVALNSMGFNIARSTGPAIGGIIVAAAGAATAFILNALSYIGLIIVLARWKSPERSSAMPRETLGSAMAAGIRYVMMSPNISNVLIRATIFGLGASGTQALLPLIAHDHIGGGPLSFGLMLGSFGLGAVFGAFSSSRLRKHHSIEWIVRGAFATFALSAVIIAYSYWLPLTMAVLFFAGGGWVLALATFNVSVQLSAPRWVVARALALYQMSAFGGMALGSWIWGIVTGHWGLVPALLLSATILVLGALVGLIKAMPAAEPLDLSPSDRWREPAISLDIQPRSGPIVVTIEYRILESDTAEFLLAMDDRRRIRIRDGARHWTLLRDLIDTQIWTERYHTPTWLDYVRHNQRRTQADREFGDHIMALHQGDRPIVRRMIERQTGTTPYNDQEITAPITDPNHG